MKADAQQLRASIDESLAAGASAQTRAHLAQLWALDPGPATAGYVLSCVGRLRPHLNLTPCRLFILRSFTLEPVVPLVRAGAALLGIDLTVQLGEFNAYSQEVLAADSALYAFRPDVVLLATQLRDLAPELWERFADLPPEKASAHVQRVIQDLDALVEALRRHTSASLIVHGMEVPAWPAHGLWDGQAGAGQSQVQILSDLNRNIQAIGRAKPGVYFLDYDSLIARVGRGAWQDERKWLTMRMPIAAPALGQLAAEWLRFLCPLAGRTCKAVVTDLDNTLWGGVVGEDGLTGLQLGSEHPGAAYRAVQRVLLDLHHRGVLLAICSKNNPAEALEVIEKHPGMLLRPHHFAAQRINWSDKAQNLREIASELNIGVDALAFLDDNPVERERVRLELPEVTVLELPAQPPGFAAVLRQHPMLERLSLSAEDRERGRFYGEQQERATLQQSAASVEEFLRSLAQEMTIEPVTAATRARVAQLTQKTNQFNLTTRRYSEQEIDDWTARAGQEAYAVRVTDRFGDNGIVGVMMTRTDGPVSVIDTFLLSCRVIGRTVETAMLAFLTDRARARGADRLEGWFLPTKKNAPAGGFYSGHGFTVREQNDSGTAWTLPLEPVTVRCPDWIILQPPTPNS